MKPGHPGQEWQVWLSEEHNRARNLLSRHGSPPGPYRPRPPRTTDPRRIVPVSLGVPQADRAGQVHDGQGLTVGQVGQDVPDAGGSPDRKALAGGFGLRIPEPDRAVFASGDQAMAIRVEGQREHVVSMGREVPKPRTVRQRQNVNPAVHVADGIVRLRCGRQPDDGRDVHMRLGRREPADGGLPDQSEPGLEEAGVHVRLHGPCDRGGLDHAPAHPAHLQWPQGHPGAHGHRQRRHTAVETLSILGVVPKWTPAPAYTCGCRKDTGGGRRAMGFGCRDSISMVTACSSIG